MTGDKETLSAPAMFDHLRSEGNQAKEHGIAPPQEHSQDPEADGVTGAAGNSEGRENTIAHQQGRLSVDARRALVYLLRHGVILAHGKQPLFDILVREQAELQDHLADMFLRVLVDEKAGVAVLLQQEMDEDVESVSLITRRALSLYDTLLLLVLRKHFQERETAGEQRVFIDVDRIESRLTPFLPLTNNSRSDRRKLSSSLKNMKDRRLLQSVPGDDERFEITPVIRYVVNAEFLEQLLGEYEVLAEKAGMETQ